MFRADCGLLSDPSTRLSLKVNNTPYLPRRGGAIPTTRKITGGIPYRDILLDFPEVTRPNKAGRMAFHRARHHVVTTSGRPVALEPKQSVSNKLNISKNGFSTMAQLVLTHPFARGLHTLRPKRILTGDWAKITLH